MSFAISFVIPGKPVPKGRPRSSRQHDASGAEFVRTYTPKRTARYEREVRLFARAAFGSTPPLAEAVHIDLVVYLPIAKSWTKAKQRAAREGKLYPITKPDLDNIEKAVTDGCNGIVYEDDAQIVEVVKAKRYSDNPHVWVRICSMDYCEGEQ